MFTDKRVDYLEELVCELDSRGLVSRVVQARPDSPAFLRVINPNAANLSEHVTCGPVPDSCEHYYWWSWGEPMHQVGDPGGAAAKVARVLGA